MILATFDLFDVVDRLSNGDLTFSLIALIAIRVAYFGFFHPLAAYPGPKFWAVSRLPWAFHTIRGDVFLHTRHFHSKYGPIIRIAPDELAFSTPEAWKDIYSAKPELRKDPYSMTPPLNGADSLFTAEGDSHKRIRRVFIGAFSDKALREQSATIERYASLFIERIRVKLGTDSRTTINIQPIIGEIAFDTISDLTWGEEAHITQKSREDDWNMRLFQHAQFSTIRNCLSRFSPAHKILHYVFLRATSKQRIANTRLTTERIKRRLALNETRPDFMAPIIGKISNDPRKGISLNEVLTNGLAVIIANSQLVSIAISAAIFLLLKSPEPHNHLLKELKDAGFENESQITVQSTRSLTYLQAVINEALRIHHPTPINLPRVVPDGGMVIAGHFVPGHSIVGVNLHNIHTTTENFCKPLEFHPERFLDSQDKRYKSEFQEDCLEAFNPFSRGPRNCIGYKYVKICNVRYRVTLADNIPPPTSVFLAQSRVSLARLFWTFSLELGDCCSLSWLEQKGWLVYEPKALPVRLSSNSR